MTVAQIARAARTLRELDPENIETLRNLDGRERDAESPFASTDVEVLFGAGCVSQRIGSPPLGGSPTVAYSVNATGTLVLRLLATYRQ
jgi:hypothetical protein